MTSLSVAAGVARLRLSGVLAAWVLALLCAGAVAYLSAVTDRSATQAVARAAIPAGARAGTLGSRPGLGTLPLAAQAPISAALGRDDRSFWIRPSVSGGAAAVNRADGLRVSFGTAGAAVSAGGAHVSLRLAGVSAGGRPVPTGPGVAQAPSTNRIDYRFAGLSEWFVNGPAGLEQGFTVRHALGSGRLSIDVALRGDRAAFSYQGLVVSDARGHLLPATMRPARGGVRISVDARGAVYPLRVDPTLDPAQVAKLTAAGGDDSFGDGVAISGSTIAVGSAGIGNDQGVVYVFEKPAGGWVDATQTAELLASNGEAGSFLGGSVGISGSTIVAGAKQQKVGSTTEGAVYVWTEPAGGWKSTTQTAELTASDGAAAMGGGFGSSVAVSGSTIVAAGPARNLAGGADAAYVFTEPAGGWANATQTAELAPSSGAGQQTGFAGSVAVSGSTIAVGSDDATAGGNNGQGAVFVYTEPAGGWANATQTAVLTGSDSAPDDFLGGSVAVSGSTIVAGAEDHTVAGQTLAGSAYVFSEPAGGWRNATQTAELTASDPVHEGELGVKVAISGSTIAVAASEQPAPGNPGTNAMGVVDLFSEPAGGWVNATQTTVIASDAQDPNIDYPVLSGSTLLTDSGNVPGPGSVLVWSLTGPPPGTVASEVHAPSPARAPKVSWSAVSSKLSVNAAGTAPLPVSCPAGRTGCAGQVRLVVSRTASAARALARSRPLTIASAKLKLAAGHKKSLKLKLSHAGLALLRHVKHHELKVTAVLKSAKHTTSRQITLRLKAKQAKHKRH